MESKVAREAKQAMLEDIKRMSHEQRLEAFITHCQLMIDLVIAGERYRAEQAERSP
jgi:hypothetical protein